jgi:FtsP/CotA-like multicopper oxidase with cupredoxin domain
MNRREFFADCGRVALAGALAKQPLHWAAHRLPADYALRIAPLALELAPRTIVRTVAYNGAVPGPLIRLREGEPATIDVTNDTDREELVHWHGLAIPSDVDGAMEEGTPSVPPHQMRRYTFTPRPAGFRWYHTHGFAGHDLGRATYSGQFGCVFVEPAREPGRYDQELFLSLHDWDPYISGGDDGYQMVKYNLASINGRMLGAGDPIRVRQGERVLLHILNASATDAHWLGLPRHLFTVTALDGNAVPTPAPVDLLRLGPAERVDAVVTMDQPGVWVLGEARDHIRKAGMGVVVEYADAHGPPQWITPARLEWDYTAFGRAMAPNAVRDTEITRIPLVFKSEFHGHGDFEHWTINGKSFPRTDTLVVNPGARYRLVFDNQSTDDHPVHLHRHRFELVKVGERDTSGVFKDVVVVPAGAKVEAVFTADNPGRTLFHCHQQDHMDSGFMMLIEYA